MDVKTPRDRVTSRAPQTIRGTAPASADTATGVPQGAKPFRQQVKNRSKIPYILGGVVAVLVLGALLWSAFGFGTSAPQSDRYQMVYLDDGKVFFGKLKNTTGEYLRLEQAYSIRQSGNEANAGQQTDNSNVNLIKVSDLVYGPESVMMIRSEKVNFWQDLKENSKVTKAIEEAQK